MKLVIVPGFLGYADEANHIDLISRSRLVGIDAEVIESEDLAERNFWRIFVYEF